MPGSLLKPEVFCVLVLGPMSVTVAIFTLCRMLTIGKDCVFADNVMVNSGEHPLDSLHDVQPGGDIVIGDRVFLGQNVSVLGGVTMEMVR